MCVASFNISFFLDILLMVSANFFIDIYWHGQKELEENLIKRYPSKEMEAKTVYLYDRADKDGYCFPAINTIARDLSISRSTVKRAIYDLE